MGGDRELVAACVRGDRQAWVRLVREHDRKVLQVLYRFKDTNIPFRVGQQMDVFIAADTQGAEP